MQNDAEWCLKWSQDMDSWCFFVCCSDQNHLQPQEPVRQGARTKRGEALEVLSQKRLIEK